MIFAFNGVFQKCTPLSEATGSYEITMTPSWRCDNLVQVNPMTKGFTCQENYEPVPITNIIHQFADRTEQRSYTKCRVRWFIKRCHTVYFTAIMKDRVQLESFWCRAKPNATIPPNSGAMFGGIYTSAYANVFTGGNSCPATYVGYQLFFDVTVCISYDYQLGSKYMIPFNGFFSCQSTQKKCDPGYTQHLVEIFDGCAVYYCVTPESYLRLDNPVIKRPPYTDAALAASSYSEDTILAYYNEEQVMDVPVSEAIRNYVQELQQKMGGTNKKIVLKRAEVQNVIDGYMNYTSEQILDLIDKYPNKTWGEIINLLSNPQSPSSSMLSNAAFITVGIISVIVIAGGIFGFVIFLIRRRRVSNVNYDYINY